MMRTLWTGCGTALVTPFAADGSVDENGVRRLARRQIDAGIHFLVPCGTTGESPTLSEDERVRIVELVVQEAAGKVPVLAGAGGYDTRKVIHVGTRMLQAGAAGLLSVTPYYNKPTPEGLYQHYRAIAEAVPLPIIVYNVPSRTVADISVETLAEIGRLPNVIGVKDATGNLGRVSAQRLASGTEFVQLSGNDETALAFNVMGGVGCISVTANVAPRLCSDFQAATREGRWSQALELQDRLYPLHAALFTDASPGPAKYALTKVRAGFPIELRLPLTEPSQASRATVDSALAHAGLI